MHRRAVDGADGRTRWGSVRRSSPFLLLAAGSGALVVALLAGVLGWQGLVHRADALQAARAETAQQVKLQTVRTSLVIADTDAGIDVLTGADPDRFSYRLFRYRTAPALLGLVTAARTDVDAADLATANSALGRYLMQVQSARTLAVTGRDQEATQALTDASGILHDDVLPRLARVQEASRQRLDGDRSAADLWPLTGVLIAVVAVAALIAVQVWLTRRTHRMLNLGLVTGTVALVLVTGVGATVVVAGGIRVRDAQDHALAVADAVVEARFAAFDARSGEALAVLHGDSVDARSQWEDSISSARNALVEAGSGQAADVGSDVTELVADLQAYEAVHARLLSAARAGRERRVEQIATDPAQDGAIGSFEAFDTNSGALLARQVQSADDAWAAAGRNLRVVGLLTLGVGLLAAGLCWAGIAARRREYR